MTLEEVKRRAAALARLAERGGTEAEAIVAAGKLQELLSRYGLDQALLDEPEEDPGPMINTKGAGDPLDTGVDRANGNWRRLLAHHLARANGCVAFSTYGHKGKVLHLVGRAGDCDTVRYIYTLVANQVLSVSKVQSRGMGAIYARNFREGMVERIGERLKEAKSNAEAQFRNESIGKGVAIVKVNAAVAKYDERYTESYRVSRQQFGIGNAARYRSYARTDPNAREAGRAAGNNVNLGGGARGALSGPGPKQLGKG